MKLLLTSLGLGDEQIVASLEGLLGGPLGECRALYVPTAMHGIPGGAVFTWEAIGRARPGSWREFAMLELTALPELPRDIWLHDVRAADAIIVEGGNTPYLAHWMRRSGFDDVLRSVLDSTVYVGISAGSMVATAGFHVDRGRLERDGVYDDDLYGDVAPVGAGSDATLGLVDFEIRPHLASEYFPDLTLERIAATVTRPTYVLDDRSAVAVDGTEVRVVGSGDWRLLGG